MSAFAAAYVVTKIREEEKKQPHFVRCKITGKPVHDLRCLLMKCSTGR